MFKNNQNTIITIVKIVVLVFAVASLFIIINNHLTTKQEAESTNNALNNVRQINQTNKNYKASMVQHQFDNEEPDLNSSERNGSKKLVQGFKLAYNNCGTPQQFNANQEKIKNLLGNSLASPVLAEVKPTTNQAIKNHSISQKIDNIDIGYGQFNAQNKILPMHILIKYQTVPFVNGSGDTKELKKQPHTYYSVFDVYYKTQEAASKQFELVFHDGTTVA